MTKPINRPDKRRSLTAQEIATAKEMRATYNIGWSTVCRRMGIGYEMLRRAVDPAYGAHKREMARNRQEYHKSGKIIRSSIPAQLLVERDQRLIAQPQSVTAAVFGDPPPGRSALDQKNHST